MSPLTTRPAVGMIHNVRAELLLRERIPLTQDAFAEVVIWRLSKPAPGSAHSYKYRLAFIVDDECVLRYDNEAGKGDHRHTRTREFDYAFESPEKLVQDFLREARRFLREDSNP